MSKFKALQVCHIPGKGRMVPAFDDPNGKRVWDGDIEDLPDEVGASFGPRHLEKVGSKESVRRYDQERKKNSGTGHSQFT